MTDNNDTQWLNDITGKYQWPEPSRRLKRKVLMQVTKRETKPAKNYMAVILDMFTFNWQPACALASALILGVYVGGITLPQSTESAQQTGIYTNADFIFAQSIIIQHQGKDASYE